METAFTPLSSFGGGLLIGGAAVLLMVANGRIAGVSGIVGGLLSPRTGEIAWRMAFVIGLIIGPLLVRAVTGSFPEIVLASSSGLLIGAGLLVGYGSRLGSGCTSGHGVCGLARLSPRSMAATCVFIAVAMATVFIVRHGIGG